MRLINCLIAPAIVLAALPAISVAAPEPRRLALAADRVEIAELGARFDNALDAENEARFVGTFTPDGVLAGFWGEAKGAQGIAGAFRFMLGTFARNRHHVVTNHEIDVKGNAATMFTYLTVFDRATLSIIGTASFEDRLVRTPAGWRFARRTLKADPNVQPIIDRLPKGQ